jgi:hypothetical protein
MPPNPPRTLAELLLERAFAPKGGRGRLSSLEHTPISRRQFVSSASSLGTAAYAVATDPLSPSIVRDGRSYILTYGGKRWRVDPGLFGSRALVRKSRSRAGRLELELRNAVLPGTDFNASFVAIIEQWKREWRISLSIPEQSFHASAPLAAWLGGACALASPISTRRIRAADVEMVLGPGAVRLEVSPHFGLRFEGSEQPFALGGALQCEGSSLTLDVEGSGEGSFRKALGAPQDAATRFRLGEPRLATSRVAIPLGLTVSAGSVNCCSDAVTDVWGELYSTAGGDRSIAVIEGAMRVFGGAEILPAEHAAQARLEHGALTVVRGGGASDTLVAGRVQRASFVVAAGDHQFLVAGDDERPFFAQASNGAIGEVRIPARLVRAWVPVEGADGATLSLPGNAVDIMLAAGASVSPDTPPKGGRIMLGENPFVAFPLDGTKLHIRRGVDLLNLTFAFDGFDLQVKEGNAWLVRRRPLDERADWPPATVAVTFPPQHVAEQYTKVTNPKCEDDLKLPDVCLSRLSAPSRVVFKLDSRHGHVQWTERALTIDALTDWSELALAVDRRALETDANIETQLAAAGVRHDTTAAQLSDLLRAQLQPPAAHHTAITMTGRLVLSPSEGARWLTRRGPVDPRAAPLWHARLDEKGRKSVRAIWSRYMQPGEFGAVNAWDGQTDMLPLNPVNHRDLVLQSSVYALPALLRMTDDKSTSTNPKATTLPRSRVVKPKEEDLAFLYAEPYKGLEIGIALAQAFDDADIILTGIGGSFVGEWQGEPPTLATLPNGDRPDTPKLERLRYRSQLGRDIRVEAVNKGFMCPIGIRCSYVTITERRFFPHPKLGHPVGYLVSRSFIVFGKPDKAFHGVNQPFEGRDFPARRVQMLTTKTPDLLRESRPANALFGVLPDGTVVLSDIPPEKNYQIFWPRTPAHGEAPPSDYEFVWRVDDDDTPLTSNLLFVDNAAVSDETAMAAVVRYYRGLTGGDERLRIAKSSGAKRRYAPAKSEGETSFDTDSWLMSATGRLHHDQTGAQSDAEHFAMDARMEGSDQPPIYPLVERALINIQSVDRLLGRPQGLISVGFTPDYVRDGFNSSINPAEIYLAVLGPDIALDVSNQGESSGGVAKPNALLVALSRKTGPVGGSRGAPTPAQDLATRQSHDRPTGVVSPYQFAGAQSGKFNPAEFFGGLKSAKLLGIIPLERVLAIVDMDEAPKLIEQATYGVTDSARQAMSGALGALTPVLTEAKHQLDRVVVSGMSVGDLYPALRQQLTVFTKAVTDGAIQVSGSGPLTDTAAAVTAIVREGKALLVEIERVLEHPLPAVAQAALDNVATAWRTLKEGLNNQYFTVSGAFQAAIETYFTDFFCTTLGDDLAGALLGDEFGTPSCKEILLHPLDALRAVGETLFEAQFGGPLMEMLVLVRGLSGEVTGAVTWARSQFRDFVSAGTAALWSQFGDRLGSTLTDTIKNEISKLSTRIDEEFATRIPGARADVTSFDDVDTALAKLDADLANLDLSFVDVEVDKHAALFAPKAGVRADALLRDVKVAIRGDVRVAIDGTVRTEIRRMRALLAPFVQQARAQTIDRLLKGGEQTLRGLLASSAFAQIATAAQNDIQGWCKTAIGSVPPVIKAIDAFASGVLGTQVEIRQALADMSRAATGLRVPTIAPELQFELDRAVAAVNATIAQLVVIVERLDRERMTLANYALKTDGTSCMDPAALIRVTGRVVALRRDAVARVISLVERAADVQATLAKSTQSRSHATDTQDGSVALSQLIVFTGMLLHRITGLEAIASGRWEQEKAKLTGLLASTVTGLQTHREELRKLLDALDAPGRQLYTALENVSVDEFYTAATAVRAYVDTYERRLVAMIAQTVGASYAVADDLLMKSRAALGSVMSTVGRVYVAADAELSQLMAPLNVEPVRTLINPDLLIALNTSWNDVKTERDLFAAGDVASAEIIVARWSKGRPALAGFIATLANLADAILKGDLGAIANLNVFKAALSRLEAAIRDAVRDVLPTKVHLSYDWQTSLGAFPKDGAPIFSMVKSAPDDLTLSVDIIVDILANTRSALVKGTMKPFRIDLLGSLPIAGIVFAGATFESKNGGDPRFAAQVDTVELKELIQFLKPLQSWMSPEGGGFYMRPVFHPLGIEAGYRFDADVIPLGAILFVNVSLGVSARLPFTGEPALFTFDFASIERPFMIVAPPYGGGGSLGITANADRIVGFRLYLLFGAIVPIKFGPLSAQGRVSAGMYIIKTEESRTIGALVEAIGEGHIACFGIAVCLRVGLEQRDDGQMHGFAEFSFSIKYGFVKLTFRFMATYTARNDRQDAFKPGQADRANGLVDATTRSRLAATSTMKGADSCSPTECPVPRVFYSVTTPLKSRSWNHYRDHIAMDLL